MMRPLYYRVIGLWACWLGCAGAAGAQEFIRDPAEYRHAPSGLTLPSHLGDFRKGGQVEYEPRMPGLGVQLSYVLPEHRMVADIYIYNLGARQLADGEATREVNQVFLQSVGDIYAAQKQGRYADVRQHFDGVVSFGADPAELKARAGEFSYQISGVDMHSRLYLFARRNHFIKLRISVPQANAGFAPALVQGLMNDLAQVVSGSSPQRNEREKT